MKTQRASGGKAQIKRTTRLNWEKVGANSMTVMGGREIMADFTDQAMHVSAKCT